MESVTTLDEILHLPSSVDGTAIPEKKDGAAEMLEHIAEEGLHLRSGDIARVKVDEQSHALAFRRDGNCGDGGNPVTLVAVTVNWRLARGRPCLSNIGDEQKSALIEEREMGPKFLRFFLYVAMFSFSNVQWQSRPVGWRDAPAFANSIPYFSAMARYSQDDRRHPSGA